MVRKRLLIPSIIACLSVASSFGAELLLDAVPCLLCLVQRCCWILAACSSLSLLFCNGKREERGERLCLLATNFSLTATILFGLVHASIDAGWVKDFCVRSALEFETTAEYVSYLSKHPPCGKDVATIAGLPAYLLSITLASISLAASFSFKKHLFKKQTPIPQGGI